MQSSSNQSSNSLQDSWQKPELGFFYYWLGQAGFAIKINNSKILIDPYLSDSLAEKYKGMLFPHVRMMAAPIEMHELLEINWVFCTHRHTDHMDPETLIQIHKANPLCRFLVPKAWMQRVNDFGIPKVSISPMNAYEQMVIDETITVEAIPAAHEQIEMDSENNHLNLGYIIKTTLATIYHSGDCIPYHGLIEKLTKEEIDVAFLPVNGRDSYRKEHGVPGNFTIDEAIEICIEASIPNLVCHHFGMFRFNTIEKDLLIEKKRANAHKLTITIPEINKQYQINLR